MTIWTPELKAKVAMTRAHNTRAAMRKDAMSKREMNIVKFDNLVSKYETRWGYRPLRASLNQEDYRNLKASINLCPTPEKGHFIIDGVDIVIQKLIGPVRML